MINHYCSLARYIILAGRLNENDKVAFIKLDNKLPAKVISRGSFNHVCLFLSESRLFFFSSDYLRGVKKKKKAKIIEILITTTRVNNEKSRLPRLVWSGLAESLL